jgi:hypothetical protein
MVALYDWLNIDIIVQNLSYEALAMLLLNIYLIVIMSS